MPIVRVNLGPRSYDIVTADGESSFGEFVRLSVPEAKLALLVADDNTRPHAEHLRRHLDEVNLRTAVAVVPNGEPSKSLAQLSRLYDALAELPADRRTLVVAVGGGVVGDLAGFAAATYNRGLPLLMVPTTLLAMVDSSVGGKTGINHARGKNLIGSFHQPSGVWIDPQLLATLPDREYRSGLAEVVKYGVIQDAEFFAYLESNVRSILTRNTEAVQRIVSVSCQRKADVVEQDEREETGLRAILNYGHTFAHAFESVAGYGDWLHGEAVAAGMVCASRLAEKLGRIDATITQRQIALLTAFGLPTKPDARWSIDSQLIAMRRDKKATAGRLRFVLPTKLGHVELVDEVDESLVRDVLRTV